MAMKCPECGSEKSKVYDSRPEMNGAVIQRRRECPEGHRWATLEITHDDDLQEALIVMYAAKKRRLERKNHERKSADRPAADPAV